MIRLQEAQSYCREQLHFKDEDFYVRGLSTLVWTPQSLKKLIGLSNAEEHVLDVSHTVVLFLASLFLLA